MVHDVDDYDDDGEAEVEVEDIDEKDCIQTMMRVGQMNLQ